MDFSTQPQLFQLLSCPDIEIMQPYLNQTAAQAPLDHSHVTHLNKSHLTLHLFKYLVTLKLSICLEYHRYSKLFTASQEPSPKGNLIGPFNKSNCKSPHTVF